MQQKIINKYDLDTPALILDLDIMERNIKNMADFYSNVNAELRPHVKTHKTPIISKMQIEKGAIGVTCQKLGEAEIFAQAGIKNILISNQVANREKIRRLAGLSTWADITVGVDNYKNVKDISEAAVLMGTTINVGIEVNLGRCGVKAGQPVLNLVKKINDLKGIKFKGIWCHQGAVIPTTINYRERKEAYHKFLKPVLETKHLLENNGIQVEICSAGFTAVYDMVTEYPEVTDVQAGSYVFMDWPYKTLEGLEKFNTALSVLTTVISKPSHQNNKIYSDCGLKSITPEHTGDYTKVVFPKVKGELAKSISLVGLSEEHGILEGNVKNINVGDKLEFIPSHSCTTTNLHDCYYCVRGDKVVAKWPILARGRAK